MGVIQLILLLLILIQIPAYSQVDYDKIKRKKLEPITIDTVNEDVLIVEKRYATLYFKKADVRKYTLPHNKLGVRIDQHHNNLLEAVNASGDTRLVDWWNGYTDDERQSIHGNPNFVNEHKKALSEFYYVGADLIHDGKFMVVDKSSGEEVRKRLKMKRVIGLYGSRYLEFLLPNGQQFWHIVTRLGE
ncbi:hypothetical protein C8N40_1061 [Pontibacter mucosus]|uniref:Uncharacterized protein n=1 Tax=Pontibacter mucosus TaxID=1649266 RepID=A0A2T5YFX2_9BACT|nr:hypothetical protein [Pontibacter mucosus]PTX18202.1 hypothetical protein C8N40_1061 [Pontibacter mucosus]